MWMFDHFSTNKLWSIESNCIPGDTERRVHVEADFHLHALAQTLLQAEGAQTVLLQGTKRESLCLDSRMNL